MTADELLQEYRRLAIAYGEAGDACDPEASNAIFDQLAPVQMALRNLGQERRILELLNDPSEHVRLWAGFDALYFSPEDGVRVLRELEQGPRGEVRFNAWATLNEWEKGELVLLPWENDE